MHNASGIVTYLMRIWLNRTKIADDFSAVIDSMLLFAPCSPHDSKMPFEQLFLDDPISHSSLIWNHKIFFFGRTESFLFVLLFVEKNVIPDRHILANIEILKMRDFWEKLIDFCDFLTFFHEIIEIIGIQLWNWSQTEINWIYKKFLIMGRSVLRGKKQDQ